ncbi:MAG: zinc-ribbon domain-containing protein, partial [Candidatus Binatia bacterium]
MATLRRSTRGGGRGRCPGCDAEYAPRTRRCTACGRGLSGALGCARCGASNPARHKFCSACGAPLA